MLAVDPPVHDPLHPEAEGDPGVGFVTDGDHVPTRVHFALEPTGEGHHNKTLALVWISCFFPEMKQTLEQD